MNLNLKLFAGFPLTPALSLGERAGVRASLLHLTLLTTANDAPMKK
jgi:hypothetical protein